MSKKIVPPDTVYFIIKNSRLQQTLSSSRHWVYLLVSSSTMYNVYYTDKPINWQFPFSRLNTNTDVRSPWTGLRRGRVAIWLHSTLPKLLIPKILPENVSPFFCLYFCMPENSYFSCFQIFFYWFNNLLQKSGLLFRRFSIKIFLLEYFFRNVKIQCSFYA